MQGRPQLLYCKLLARPTIHRLAKFGWVLFADLRLIIRTVQGHLGSKYMGPVKNPLMVSYLTSFESNNVYVFIFEIFVENVLWPKAGTVQGHIRSKVILPIGSPLMVSYLTSIVSNIVPLKEFKIFDVKIPWPRARTVQGHPRSKVMVPIDSS